MILVDSLIPMQWSNVHKEAWHVMPAARQLNPYPEIILNVRREILSGGFSLHRAGCLRIGAIDLITECTGVAQPPLVHLVSEFVKHVPQLSAESCPRHMTCSTAAPAVWPDQLKVCNVASCDCIKQDDIINELSCPLIVNNSIIIYPSEFTDELRDGFLYIVRIQQHALVDH
jgi:hypothetical protein